MINKISQNNLDFENQNSNKYFEFSIVERIGGKTNEYLNAFIVKSENFIDAKNLTNDYFTKKYVEKYGSIEGYGKKINDNTFEYFDGDIKIKIKDFKEISAENFQNKNVREFRNNFFEVSSNPSINWNVLSRDLQGSSRTNEVDIPIKKGIGLSM